MKVGLSLPLPAYTIDPAFMGAKAEALGFNSIWYAEHPAVPVKSESPFPATGGEIPWTYSHFTEPFIALARASGVTKTIQLGTGITLVPQRHPMILAKEVAALDFHSGGRFQFGIGTGWLREEVELFGGDFPRRWTQTREALDAMKAVWTNDSAGYEGKYFKIPEVRVYPKPAQKPYPPIIIGGGAKNVLKRIVDHADGWLPNRVTPEELVGHRTELNRMAEAAGRDPKSLRIIVYGQMPDADLFAALFKAGADEVVVRPQHVETEAEMGKQLEDFARLLIKG
jgi:probable F420-dependent oxidoreductase